MTTQERDDLVELIAQAVIDRIEARERVNRMVEMVLERLDADEVDETRAKPRRARGGKRRTDGEPKQESEQQE